MCVAVCVLLQYRFQVCLVFVTCVFAVRKYLLCLWLGLVGMYKTSHPLVVVSMCKKALPLLLVPDHVL